MLEEEEEEEEEQAAGGGARPRDTTGAPSSIIIEGVEYKVEKLEGKASPSPTAW